MTDQNLADPVESTAPSTSRALVVMQASRPVYADERPQADFLTQLIACERRLPAYRQARNAEPETATHAYGRHGGNRARRLDCVV